MRCGHKNIIPHYFQSMNYYIKPSSVSAYILYSLSLIIFYISISLQISLKTTLFLWEITTIYNSEIYFPLILDPIGVIFSSIVLFISANVIKFASTYIEDELFLKRFIYLVLLFVLSINILIFFPHLMTLLLGWDGLGLISFLLVIYYQNAKSLGAGIITALTNRIGDVALLLSIAWSINNHHWFITNIWDSPINKLIITSILIAAITKRAQIPFSRWLPAAMAAPTPVSALVHSSTLVTAGVFLLIRFYPFLRSYNWFCPTLLITASLTIFIAGISALIENDLKKIIALSTLRQLGVIIAALGLGLPKLAFFHLATHALFKALLFICAGSIIHFHHHGQDLRSVGNLTTQLPITITSLSIANISLCGLPFLSGFYSKDLILELAFWNPLNWAILRLLALATSFTAAYSIRLTITAICSNNINIPTHFINNHDLNISIPSILLTTGAICAGSLINWSVAPIALHPILPPHFKALTIICVLIGGLTAFTINPFIALHSSTLKYLNTTHEALTSIWFLAPLSTQNILKFPINLAHQLQKNLDHGWIEISSAQGAYTSLISSSQIILYYQNNNINIFLYMITILFLPIILLLII